MTTNYGKINFGFEADDDNPNWFAYTTGLDGSDFAQSTKSQADAFMKLADLLAAKLHKIQIAANTHTDNCI